MLDLTEGRPFRALLIFALPVIGGNLFQLFYTLADSVIVGRTLGADALAAVGATSILYSALSRALPMASVSVWASDSAQKTQSVCAEA